ncbi:siderophore-interacting protein [Rhizobium alvei]|uniref:Siderophore-interacting protein n=1 Tax=Rhizobium alvei TaxID=1132659 RepID=A0ABT8YMV7_9HYPH|nr:siderophore-interacting protein [Rhizobium alvei]MDO6964555.1 siderophore-interacting protein [Rhizobium alvei]
MQMLETNSAAEEPIIRRVRHDLKRRMLAVAAVERITPNMMRIVLTGDDLADFPSAAPDDHVKLFVPDGEGTAMRDYTPRRFDRAALTLTLDFALHEAGPATSWALSAKPGDQLQIGGPRGSAILSDKIRHLVLIGDETALPAIGRRIEEAGADCEITAIVAVTDAAERQSFESPARLDLRWVYRDAAQADVAEPLLDAVGDLALKAESFVWIAAEAQVARSLRAHFLDRLGHDRGWVKAAGYWKKGVADGHEKFED